MTLIYGTKWIHLWNYLIFSYFNSYNLIINVAKYHSGSYRWLNEVLLMLINLIQSMASEDSFRTCMESSANLKCGKKTKNI